MYNILYINMNPSKIIVGDELEYHGKPLNIGDKTTGWVVSKLTDLGVSMQQYRDNARCHRYVVTKGGEGVARLSNYRLRTDASSYAAIIIQRMMRGWFARRRNFKWKGEGKNVILVRTYNQMTCTETTTMGWTVRARLRVGNGRFTFKTTFRKVARKRRKTVRKHSGRVEFKDGDIILHAESDRHNFLDMHDWTYKTSHKYKSISWGELEPEDDYGEVNETEIYFDGTESKLFDYYELGEITECSCGRH